jgi:vitamin B12 transporter
MAARSIILLASASLATLAAPAYAQSTVQELTVVTRLPQPLSITPGAYVLDRAALDARGAVFAADALSGVPGLSVFRNGAFGGVTSVRQRGASADKTLVLFDGVPSNDASQPDGNYDFRSLDLADIERIEVLSGPQGSLWGSDAIGGVISLTTRELDGVRTAVEAGAFDTQRGSVALGAARDTWAAGISASGLRTDGISKAARLYGNTEADGFTTGTVGGYLKLRPADRVELEGRLRYNSAEAEVDGFACIAACADADFNNDVYALTDTTDVSKSDTWSGLVRARVDGPLGFRHTVSFDGYRLERTDFGAYVAERKVWRWNAARGSAEDRFALLVGAEHADTTADLASGEHADLGLSSAFAVGRATPVQGLTLTASLRYDDPETTKGEVTARAGAAIELPAGFTASASYGEGFKVPTVSQYVCDFCFPAGASTDLRPERARGVDFGLAWSRPGARASLTVYRLSVKDQITYANGRYRNIARALSRGAELAAEASLGHGFTLRGAYAYTEAEDRTADRQLLRTPKHSGSAGLAWVGARFEGGLNLRAESAQADTALDGFSRIRRPGFVVADLNAAAALTDQIRLTLRVENLADRRYQEVYGYGEAGRAAYVGLAVKY